MRHYRSCNLCEAMCGIVVEVEGDRIVDIRGDEDDSFSRGYVCPKVTALADIHQDPDRLKRPLRRRGKDFEEISWDEAFDEAGSRLRAIRDRHGRQGVAVYQGNPTIHNWGSMIFGQMFLTALGSRSKYSATSVDQLPKMLAGLLMYGNQLLLTVPDVDRTDLFVIFGANPLVSNGSLMTAPDMRGRIQAIRARGGRVVVFDPRRTETAALAGEHHFVKPSTDAFVLFGIVHVLFEEGLVDLGRFAAHVRDLDTVREAARAFAPEATARVTGVEATVVRGLARDLAKTRRAVVYGRVGVSMQEFGGVATWLVEVINLLTAHFDEEGGAMFTTPAIDIVAGANAAGAAGHHATWRTRVRGAPEFGGEAPLACLAEEIETPGKGQVRALVTSCGNPVLSGPNGRRLERALETLDYMVSVDIYVNETTRHANLILPPTFGLEHDHYDLALLLLSVRNVAKYSPALFPRAPDQRHDHEIFAELAARLSPMGARPKLARLAGSVAGRATPRQIGDLMLRAGPHGIRGRGLTMKALEDAPHGIDLGPLERTMPGRLRTKSKAIELSPKAFVDDVPRLAARLAELSAGAQGLVLIGRRQLRSNNSWCHNAPRLAKGKDRCTAMVHPRDAASLGITNGDRIRLASRVGEAVLPVEVTDGIMPGVVSVPHGFGHDRPGTRLSVAAEKPGVSLNDLTDESRTDPVTGVADFSGVPVRAERVMNIAELDSDLRY